MVSLYGRTGGSGPRLVILHGLFGSGQNWASLARRWEERFSVTRLDLPGHGQSPHGAPYDLPGMARAVHEAVFANDPSPVCVVAHSLGGRVALHWALSHPGALKRLVVLDVAHRPYDMTGRFLGVFRGMDSVKPESCENLAEAESRMSAHISEVGLRRFLLTNLVASGNGGIRWRIDVEGLRASLPNLGEASPLPGPSTVPTLLLSGGKSDYVAEGDLPVFRTAFPNLEHRVFPRAGHWIHAEDPEGVHDAVVQFMG